MTGKRFGALCSALGLVAVLWLATRPYHGIIHDSQLYTMLALRVGQPEQFASDLFVAFGSQDSFTLFPRLHAAVIEVLGPSRAALLLTVVGQTLWLAGAGVLATGLVQGRVGAAVALAGLVVLPPSYGGQFIFSLGEPFVTPRLFAEAATMAALGLAVRDRARLPWLLIAAAAAIHPVMTLPGAAVLLVWTKNWRLWSIAVAAGACGLGLVVAGVEPFTRLAVRFDPEWFQIVYHRSSDLFLSRWTWVDFTVLAGQAGLAVVAARVLDGAARRLLNAVLLVAAGGIAATGLGADLLHNQLITNVQPWRATWLLAAVSSLLAMPTLAALGERGHPVFRFATVCGVVLLVATRFVPVAYLGAALLLVPAAVAAVRAGGVPGASRSMLPGLKAVGAGIVGAVAILFVQNLLALQVPPEVRWLVVGSLASALAGAGLLVLPLLAPGWRPAPAAMSGLLALPLVAAASCWDQRSGWGRFAEGGEPPASLTSFVPYGATVSWSSGVGLLWFRLRHASYYSCTQGAGISFYRGTALAYGHRRDSFRFEPAGSEACEREGDLPPTPLTEAELRRTCEREPGLDLVVLTDPVAGLAAEEWVPPARLRQTYFIDGRSEVREVGRFYRYDCMALR